MNRPWRRILLPWGISLLGSIVTFVVSYLLLKLFFPSLEVDNKYDGISLFSAIFVGLLILRLTDQGTTSRYEKELLISDLKDVIAIAKGCYERSIALRQDGSALTGTDLKSFITDCSRIANSLQSFYAVLKACDLAGLESTASLWTLFFQFKRAYTGYTNITAVVHAEQTKHYQSLTDQVKLGIVNINRL